MPNPTYFAASKIYTVEFYQRVRRSLKPDGVFSMWLSATDMSEAGVRVVLSALRGSFEHCDLRFMRRRLLPDDLLEPTDQDSAVFRHRSAVRARSIAAARYRIDVDPSTTCGSPMTSRAESASLRATGKHRRLPGPWSSWLRATLHPARVAPNIFVVEREAFGINPVGDTSRCCALRSTRAPLPKRLTRSCSMRPSHRSSKPIPVLRQAWAGRVMGLRNQRFLSTEAGETRTDWKDRRNRGAEGRACRDPVERGHGRAGMLELCDRERFGDRRSRYGSPKCGIAESRAPLSMPSVQEAIRLGKPLIGGFSQR